MIERVATAICSNLAVRSSGLRIRNCGLLLESGFGGH